MPERIDADLPSLPPDLAPQELRAASHLHMARHLITPLQAGADDRPLAVGADGRVRLPAGTRHPVVLAAPRRSLEFGTHWTLTAALPEGDAVRLDFASFTQEGSFLPLVVPGVDASGHAAELDFALTLDIDGTTIDAAAVAERIIVRVTEGQLGRLLYVLGAEKLRLRRVLDEIAAARSLDTAAGPWLDRHGVDLRVPRFSDRLVWKTATDGASPEDPGSGSIVAEPFPEGKPEGDEAYRRRLKLFRAVRARTAGSLLATLNGEGDDGAANAGPLGAMGLSARFRLVEEDGPFAFAVKLMACGDTDLSGVDAYLRAHRLIRPDPAADADHAARLLATAQRARETALRERLKGGWTLDGDMGFAPLLADALARAGLALAACGVAAAERTVVQAQDMSRGSRFELGLGATVASLAPATWDAVREKAVAGTFDPALAQAPDPNVERLLRRFVGATLPSVGEDPDGRWFWTACGLPTCHRVPDGIYLSHLHVHGMVVTGETAPGTRATVLAARWNQDGDLGDDAILERAVGRGLAALAAAVPPLTAPTRLSAAETDTAFEAAAGFATPGAGNAGFPLAGLPSWRTDDDIVARLSAASRARTAVFALPEQLAADLLGADAAARRAAAGTLRRLLAVFAASGISSAAALPTGPSTAVLIVGTGALPGAGNNLAERAASAFRWHAATITAPAGQEGGRHAVLGRGDRVRLEGPVPAVVAVVAVGYARGDLTDAYEYRVALPADATLNLEQYEFLMNVLGSANPIGVEINTHRIRRDHVDLDGDGAAEPLTVRAARTFRPFQRSKRRAGPLVSDFEPLAPDASSSPTDRAEMDPLRSRP